MRGSETGVVARSESYVSSDDQPKASLRWLRGRASRPDEAHAGRRRQRRSLLIPRRRPGEGGGRPHPGRHPPSGETSGRRTVRTHFAPSPLRPFARPEDPLTRPRALVRNWKLVVEKDDTSCYEALIYQHLPCNGGGFELKSLETVERARPQERATTEADEADETLEECDQAVSFALQSLSEQSNSLAPFELVKLVRAVKLRNGVHDLALQVRQGRGSTMTVEILVREEDGYRVDKVKFL